jgi:hypothetical protein
MAIFGATAPKKSRVFQSGSATATIQDVPAILLGVTVQVNRQMSPIPTLTDGVLWSAQPVQGTLTANSILVGTESTGLVKKLAETDLCTPVPITINMGADACDNSNVKLVIADGYCSTVSFSANGNQGYVANDFTVQFTQCTIE